MEKLIIAGKEFSSRLFIGTGKFGNHELMKKAILASKTEMVTVALKRLQLKRKDKDFLPYIKLDNINILPNTSGARNAKEAIFAAELAREALETNWIKLEIHPDPKYLLPDPIETYNAAKELVKRNFIVMPYVNADPVLCKKLEDIGTATVMPLASPIGSNLGITNAEMLRIIIEQSNIPVVIDAGIGTASDAAKCMEMGADAVLVNTAIAISNDPVNMAKSFKMAVEAGFMAYKSKIGDKSTFASATSPLTEFLKESYTK